MKDKRVNYLRSFTLIWSVLFAFQSITFAQEEGTEDDPLDLGEVISIGNRNLTLKDAYKFSSNPTIKDSTIELSTLEFLVSPMKGNTQFKVDPLKPANLKIVDQLPKYYRAYVLGGFGLYASPKGELYFNSLRSRNWNYGFETKHFSGQGGIKDVPSSAWGNTNVSLWATRYLKKSAVTMKGGYNNNIVHYYGGLQGLDSLFTKDQIAQKVNSGDAMISVRSFFKDTTRINYIVNAQYKYLKDNYETKEHRARIDGHILGMYANQYYDLEYIVDYNTVDSYTNYIGQDFNDSLAQNTQTNTVVGINPAIDLHGDKWKVLAGVNMYFNNSRFHFYPRAEAYYELFDKIFIPYLGLNGEIQKKTFGEFFKENPYVISSAVIKNRNQKFNLYIGLRGKISSKLSFDIKVAHENVEDMALFVNDTLYSLENRFNIRYDKVKVNSLSASLKYTQLDKLNIGISGSFFNYSVNNELFAWNKPNVKIDFNADYNLSNKFLVGISLYYVGKRKAASLTPVEGVIADQGVYAVELNSFVDANLNFEYRYTQRLSGFLNFNNLFSTHYQTWYKYQVQPFFVLLGASYSF